MSKHCLEINNANFDEIVSSNDLVVVDFWASWCGPCKMLVPVIEELAEDYEDKAVVGKVNVDDNAELAEKFGIMTIPAVFVFRKGEVVDKMIGFRQKAQLAAALDKYI